MAYKPHNFNPPISKNAVIATLNNIRINISDLIYDAPVIKGHNKELIETANKLLGIALKKIQFGDYS